MDSWISTQKRDELKISINISPSVELSDWEVDITDNALGMSKDEVLKSFDLFYSNKTPKNLSDKYLGPMDLVLKELPPNLVQRLRSLLPKTPRCITK